MMMMPHMFDALADEQLRQPRNVGALQSCVSSGDSLPPRTQWKFEEAFGVKLLTALGSTEASGSFLPGAKTFRVSKDVQIRILASDGWTALGRKGGELSIRGPNVVVGYWESPSSVLPLSEGGWFNTGDIVREVTPGELQYVSRAQDIISRAGSNISPHEVEQALLNHPAVCGAAVIGIPDRAMGERVAGFIQLANEAARPNLHCILVDLSGLVADYKLPEVLKVVDGLPRNACGKINRVALRAAVPATWDLDRRF
jgi:long-chain acyl-CoA synthetase